MQDIQPLRYLSFSDIWEEGTHPVDIQPNGSGYGGLIFILHFVNIVKVTKEMRLDYLVDKFEGTISVDSEVMRVV